MKFDLDQWMKTWGLDRKSAATVLGMSKSGFQRALSRSDKTGSDTSKAVAAVEGLVRQLSGMDKEAVAVAVGMAERQREMRGMAGEEDVVGIAMLAALVAVCGEDSEPMPMLRGMGSIDGLRKAVKDDLVKEVTEFWATVAAEAVVKAMDLMQPELDRMTGEGWTPKAETIFDLFDWPQVYKNMGFDDGSIANVRNVIEASKDCILSQMRGYLRSRFMTNRVLDLVKKRTDRREDKPSAGRDVKKPSAGRVSNVTVSTETADIEDSACDVPIRVCVTMHSEEENARRRRTAFELGARLANGQWYVPAGTKLGPFRELPWVRFPSASPIKKVRIEYPRIDYPRCPACESPMEMVKDRDMNSPNHGKPVRICTSCGYKRHFPSVH